MGSLDKTALEILNATADDCENLEQIYRQVCFAFVPAPADGGANGVYRPREGASIKRPFPPVSRVMRRSRFNHSLIMSQTMYFCES